jgi:hypothetical protein
MREVLKPPRPILGGTARRRNRIFRARRVFKYRYDNKFYF